MTAVERIHKRVAEAVAASVRGDHARVPEAGRLLLSWFMALHRTRTYHQAGPNPITYGEIEAFARLSGTPLRPIDVTGIKAVDEAWLKSALARMKAGDDPTASQAADRGVTPQLFDAMFS